MLPPSFRRGGKYQRYLPALVVAFVLVGMMLLASALAAGVDGTPSRFQHFVGRLHPLTVHLPIGFLLLAVTLEGARSGVRSGGCGTRSPSCSSSARRAR